MKSVYRALACLIFVLAVPATAVADESLGNSVNASRLGELEAENASLKRRLEALESLLAGVGRGTDPQTGQDTLQFSGMNVQIVNGTGFSDFNSTPNGTGNLIIGYNEPNTTGQPNDRTGS